MSSTQHEVIEVGIDELISRTDAILPAIAERAQQTERDRRLPEATIQDIRDAGLNRVMQPVRWGGYGLDFDAYFEICWRISSACGSTGWVYSQSAVQNWEISRSEEHTSELQSLMRISYAVFCLKKKNTN